MERTLVIIKPDAVRNRHVGSIIQHFESEGFIFDQIMMQRWRSDTAKRFYQEHKGKEFYERLWQFMCSGPVVSMVLAGANSVAKVRKLVGATNSAEAVMGTLRSEYGSFTIIHENAVHASDSVGSADREIDLIFGPAGSP